MLASDRVARARTHLGRFPRPFWVLLAGEGVSHLGYGVFIPYVALYLTGPIGASASVTGLTMASWGLVALVTTPFGGVLADRLGRRPLMIGGLAGSAVCAVAFALASSLWVLIALVPIWGACLSMFRPAAKAYVADVVAPELRTEAYGLDRLVANATFALGPPLGALVIWLSSLHLVFLISGVTELAYLLIAWRGLPESRPALDAEAEPARLREGLRDRLLIALALGTLVVTFVYVQFDDVLGVFLHKDRGYAITTWGLVFGINPVLVTLFQYPIARWAAQRSSRAMLAFGALLHGAALFLLLPFTGIWALVFATVVLTAGEMLHAPVSTTLAADLAPVRLRATYQAVLNWSYSAAGAPATLLGFWLIGRGQFDVMLGLALPLSAIAALCFLPLPGGKRRPQEAVVEPV